MRWIGLTGGIGSGKSTVAKLLRSKGFIVLDADEMARKVVEPGQEAFEKVVETFGQNFVGPDGSLDRKALGEQVFKDKSKLSQLEQILHPAIRQTIMLKAKQYERQGHKILFYDVPLLYEKKMESQFEKVIVVDAPLEQRLQRVMRRDQLPRDLIEARVQSQLPLEEKVKQAHFVVDNSKDENWLEQQVDELIRDITSPTNSRNS